MVNNDVIELSVQVSEFMNYEIKIPRNLNPKTFPEVMKRLRAIYNMLPQENNKIKTPIIQRTKSPILELSIKESKELFEKYKKSSHDEINIVLEEKYGLEPKARDLVVGLMHRLKKRIYNLEAYK